MKKLFVVLFVMFFAGMMTAQDTTNVAETEQIGNQNEVLVKQIGDDNYAESHQYGNLNDASVMQTGDGNVAVADQFNGNQNEITLLQTGNSNKGYIAQGMITNYYGPGYETSNMAAHRNDASLEQVGNNNLADVIQTGNDNNTSIETNGNSNIAYSYQGWPYGFWNETYATSHLSSYNSEIAIVQDGNSNTGAVWQYGGRDNEAFIDQDGHNNYASIGQGFIYTDFNYDFTTPVYNTEDNYASVKQIGNTNRALLFQLGDGNSFKLTQTGDDNWVGYDVSQTGLEDGRNAYFTQDGNNNKFAGVYKSASNEVSFWESQDAEQYNGAVLSYESYQKGDWNKIGLRQGQDDLGLIQQDGDFNTSLLYQYGVDQNQATMMQTGNSNTAEVVQIQQ